MHKIKNILLALLFVTISATSFSSCMTTRTSVGQYQEIQGSEYTYAKGKQFWLFWGIVPLGRTNVNTPSDGNCEVVTRLNFGDFLISGITGGFLSSYTIKVKAKK